MQVYRYAGMQVCKYASMQVCSKYASMQQVCKYASMQACKYAGMQVCNFEPIALMVHDLPLQVAKGGHLYTGKKKGNRMG